MTKAPDDPHDAASKIFKFPDTPEHIAKAAAEFRKERAKKTPPPPPRPLTKRKKVEATELNIWKALREEEELYEGQLFKLDTFSGQTLLMHPIPVPGIEPPRVFKPTDVTDVHTSHLMVWLQANGFTKVSVSRVGHAIDMEAERNSFSSARAWLENLPAWDGERRLDHFWIDVCGVELRSPGISEEDASRRWKYLSATARCFFIGVVNRVMRPGVKVDTTPILEGPQGTQKSTLLQVLAFDNDDWFSDCLPRDLGNKDARAHLAGKLIVELAEMHQMRATQLDALKSFLTTKVDKFRPSYGRLDIKLQRQCVFVGTTNSNDYFKDITGNRRFWPIPCGTINLELAREIMPQLYAEALVAFHADEHWWLPHDVELLAEAEQNDRLSSDPWEEGVIAVVSKFRGDARRDGKAFFFVTSTQGLSGIEVDRSKWDQEKQHRVALVLKKLGGKNMKLPRGDGWPNCGYRFITEPFEA